MDLFASVDLKEAMTKAGLGRIAIDCDNASAENDFALLE